jgi:hypothetical protein
MNISYPEFCLWIKYRNKRGMLNSGLLQEQNLARFAAYYFNSKSSRNEFTISDFAPHLEKPVMSVADAIKAWG